jgi:Flp pilus assembly protein TadG
MQAKRTFWRDEGGAVAPTIALSLFGLIAAGGVAFDYARMASLDTELQQGADQAALAAATQLDGKAGTCSRAAAAAVDLITNQTRFANDGSAAGSNVVIANEPTCDGVGNVRFYSSYTNATTNTAATSDANAKYVSVTVNARQAVYALTPIVALFNSGSVQDTAVAGLGSAICKVPPVMICNPQETGGNTTFDASTLIGKGLKLVSVGNGGGWAPGNFGYLNSGGGSNGAPGLREALGWTTAPGDCIAQTGVDTKPGATVSVTDAINTRFDIYDSNVACPSGGNCPASINTIKDLLRPNNANGNNACKMHNSGWQEASPANKLYLPNAGNATTASTLTPDSMGHPRDMCHAAPSGATGYCSGPIGNGTWDRDTYFRANYGWTPAQWQTNTGLGTTPTRYAVYAWEIANRGLTIGGQIILPDTPRAIGSLRDWDKPVCSPIEGYGTGLVPAATTVDRRRFSVAVVNCTANSVNGAATNVPVEKWIDIFLVEPSFARGSASSGTHGRSGTSAGDVYVEVIGETSAGANGATAGQVVRRDKPYLIE